MSSLEPLRRWRRITNVCVTCGALIPTFRTCSQCYCKETNRSVGGYIYTTDQYICDFCYSHFSKERYCSVKCRSVPVASTCPRCKTKFSSNNQKRKHACVPKPSAT